MKKSLIFLPKCIVVFLMAMVSLPSMANGTAIGVTLGGQVVPGVYGRVDVSTMPPPQVVYAQPVVITQSPAVVQPIYMNVPPGHAKKWSKHCHQYNACGVPVYFVRTSEYGHEGRGRDKHHHDRHHEHHHH